MARNKPDETQKIISQRDEAVGDLVKAKEYNDYLVERIAALEAITLDQRKTIDDLRRQRDNAQKEASNLLSEFRAMERDLSRAMGWIDAKMDGPPAICGVPFAFDPDVQRMRRS